MIPQKFTYPFRYVPHPLVVEAAQKLIGTIDSDPLLKYVFAEGKMLGILVCEDPASGALTTLNAFSGLVGGRSVLPGFVPPIFDTTTVPALRNIEGPVPPETASLRFGPTADAVPPLMVPRVAQVSEGTGPSAPRGRRREGTVVVSKIGGTKPGRVEWPPARPEKALSVTVSSLSGLLQTSTPSILPSEKRYFRKGSESIAAISLRAASTTSGCGT